MSTREFRLPDLGEGLTEAEIVAWHVAVGDQVAVDQVVCDVETAKATVEVPCPYAGVVVELHGGVGDVVDVGKPLISVGVGAASDNGPHKVGTAPEEPADRARLDAAKNGAAKQTSGNVLVGYGTAEGGGARRRRVVSGFGGHSAPPRPHGGPAAGTGAGSAGAGAGEAAAGRAGVGGAPSAGTGSAAAAGTGAGSVSASAGASGASAGADMATGGATAGRAARTSAGGAPAGGAGTVVHGAPAAGGVVARAGEVSAGAGANSRASTTSVSAPSHGPANGKAAGGVRVAVVSPLVRRLAKEGGLDLAAVRGTGPEGLIMRRDVEAALSAPAPVPVPISGAIEVRERVPLKGLRKAVADKLSRSRREIPDATTWVDVDASGLMELREALNRDGGERRISLLALLARICVAGLARYPELNATVDVERQEIVRYGEVNLGFAAQTDRGLVVPVVHGAHRMSTEELAAEFERLTASARAGSLAVAELTGSTFTLNNYGVYGVDGSTPILNHPEAAMLGVGRIVKKPWVVSGPDGDELAIRRVTQLSFTFDHRVCDGGVAGGFLRYVADLVEEPARLLRAL